MKHMLFIKMFSQSLISIIMSITTFGRIHQSNIEEINNNKKLSEINEKAGKNKQDISHHIEEFHEKNQIDDKRNEAIWNKFSEHDKKIRNSLIGVLMNYNTIY